jgi:MbtH protein
MMTDTEDARQYRVVRNNEDQYSIWLADRPVPDGWHDEGFTGAKRTCLDHIEAVWVDMRPRSVRLQMEQAAAQPG